MKKTWKEKANELLSNVAADIPVVTGCYLHWGETELPECLRAELEEKQNEKAAV